MAHCEMSKECTEPVVMIGSKGYVYCRDHGQGRRWSGYEQTRLMTFWERDLIEAGKPLVSYAPITKAEYEAIVRGEK